MQGDKFLNNVEFVLDVDVKKTCLAWASSPFASNGNKEDGLECLRTARGQEEIEPWFTGRLVIIVETHSGGDVETVGREGSDTGIVIVDEDTSVKSDSEAETDLPPSTPGTGSTLSCKFFGEPFPNLGVELTPSSQNS